MTTLAAQPLHGPVPAVMPESTPLPWLSQVMLDTVGRTGARIGLAWIGLVAVMAVFAPFIATSHPYLLKTSDALLVARYGRVSSPLLQHLTGSDVTLFVAAVAAAALWFNRRLRTSEKLLLFCAVLLLVVPLAFWKPLQSYLRDIGHGWSTEKSHRTTVLELTGLFVLLLLDVIGIVWIFRLSSVPRRAKAKCLGLLAILAVILMVFPINPPLVTNYAQYRQAEAAGRVQFILRAPLPFSPTDRLRDQFIAGKPHPWAPERAHPLGTEVNGADVLSRMIHACRIAMAIGFIATGIAVLIGAIVGGLMGYFVGWVDIIGMRIVEIFNSIPTIYLLLAFVAFFERNLYMMMVIIGLTTWPGDARFVRAEFLRLRGQDFVQAARAAGLPLRSILFRHMLPNAMAPLLVSASFGIASAILFESVLSYLGLGLVDDPSWGQLLNQAVSEAGIFVWWLAIFPGLAIFLTVFAYNLIGEAVRDALDPKLKGID